MISVYIDTTSFLFCGLLEQGHRAFRFTFRRIYSSSSRFRIDCLPGRLQPRRATRCGPKYQNAAISEQETPPWGRRAYAGQSRAGPAVVLRPVVAAARTWPPPAATTGVGAQRRSVRGDDEPHRGSDGCGGGGPAPVLAAPTRALRRRGESRRRVSDENGRLMPDRHGSQFRGASGVNTSRSSLANHPCTGSSHFRRSTTRSPRDGPQRWRRTRTARPPPVRRPVTTNP